MSSSSSTTTKLSAADLIKRFREGQPTSAEDRKSLMGQQAKMWWEETIPNRNSKSISSPRAQTVTTLGEDSPLPRRRDELVAPEELEVDIDRERARFRERDIGGYPERSRVRGSGSGGRDRDRGELDNSLTFPRRSFGNNADVTDPRKSRLSAIDERERFREKDSPYRSRTFGPTLDVESLFQHEIHKLTEEVRKREQDTTRRLNTQIDWRDNGASVERSRMGALGRSNDAGIYGRQSIETLGSTGFLSLSRADMRLDGYANPPSKINDAKEPDTSGPTAEELNKNLEIILADLKKNAPSPEPEKTYLPSGVEETIPQILSQLVLDMEQTVGHFAAQYAHEEKQSAAAENEHKDQIEKWKQEGREEERKKAFLVALETPVYEAKDLLSVWKSFTPQQHDKVKDVLGDSTDDVEMLQKIQQQHRPRKTHDASRAMQFMIDNEISSADEIVRQMRAMRTHMGWRAHQLNAVARQSEVDGGDNFTTNNGVLPLSNHNNNPAVDSNSQFWGIEEHKDTLERMVQRERDRFSPYPALVHRNILSVAQAIESSLSTTMDLLQRRLGEEEPQPVAPSPAPLDIAIDLVANSTTKHGAGAITSTDPSVIAPKDQTNAMSTSFEFDLSLSRPNSPERGKF
jgi:hypothetical protein